LEIVAVFWLTAQTRPKTVSAHLRGRTWTSAPLPLQVSRVGEIQS